MAEKIITDFSWRRIGVIFGALLVVGFILFIYESYTQTFSLEKIDKQISLLERLYIIESENKSATDPELKDAFVNIKNRLNQSIGERGSLLAIPEWLIKFVSAFIGWTIVGCIFWLAMDKDEKKNVILGMSVLALPLCFLSAIVPTIAGWFNYIIVPILQIFLVLGLVAFIGKKPKNA